MNRYYDIRDDIETYSAAWAYLIWSARGPGKTYSTLRFMKETGSTFVFLKRTIEDIKMLCTDGAKKGVDFDISPWVPLNRDFGWNVKPVQIVKGIAGFYDCDADGKPVGKPLGYACALSAAKDIKGFDMSDADYLVFDEFIPKRYERQTRTEGDQLLDIYMTISRDRMKRGRPELKLICLANATSVNNPVFQIFGLVDAAVGMDVTGREYNYIEERRILMHALRPEDYAAEEKSGIEMAMTGSEWAEMAFGGHFGYDDFSAVHRQNLKNYRPVCSYTWKQRTTYIYVKDGMYYAGRSKAVTPYHYDLKKENDQKRFWSDFVIDLRAECIEDRMIFETYTDYDLIVNYKQIFKI